MYAFPTTGTVFRSRLETAKTFHAAGGVKRNVRRRKRLFYHFLQEEKQCLIEPEIIARVGELVKRKGLGIVISQVTLR